MMNVLSAKPSSCRENGLQCNQCVGASARQIAAACGEMTVREVEEIFFAMYDDPACASMSGDFVEICLNRNEGSWIVPAGASPAFCY